MARLTPGSDASAALGKAFKSHGFHDACDLRVIDRRKVLIVVEACSDAFSTIKPVLIIEDGLDSCTNKSIRTRLYPAFLAGVEPFVERGAIEL